MGDRVQQSRGVDGFSERETTSSKNDNCPQEIVEVFLSENTGAKEENKRDDSNNAHVPKNLLKLVGETPQEDSYKGSDSDEPLNTGELVLDGTDWHDSCALARVEGDQEEDPDRENRKNADREGDEEPATPTWRGVHVLESNDVLGTSDWRGHTTDV